MLPVVGITIMFPVVGFSSHPSPYQRLLVSSMGKEKQTGLEIFGNTNEVDQWEYSLT